MRILVLWTRPSGYFNACLKALNGIKGVEIYLVCQRADATAPYASDIFSWIDKYSELNENYETEGLLEKISTFNPDAILSANWHFPIYRTILKKFNRSVRVLASDRPWVGNFRQWCGILLARFYLHPISDVIFVAGDRQVRFVNLLGFTGSQILTGLYSCDFDKFSEIFSIRKHSIRNVSSFVYIGRLSPEKGIETLLDAYKIYRCWSKRPLPLLIYGVGPLKYLIDNADGIVYKGFCDPEDLPNELLSTSCLILPSLFEPWGVVVHEAAAAGLALIVSSSVGSSVHLVKNGYNGYITEPKSPKNLAECMLNYDQLTDFEKDRMSEKSHQMSKQYTPDIWAKKLIEKCLDFKS